MSENIQDRPIAVQVTGVKKMYKLGQIGGGSLQKDLQSWWARKRGKEDPNSIIGAGERSHGDTFMALNGVDLTIYQGEAVGIIGSNGAGKSTLLKLLSRVTAPTEGVIDIYGRIASMLEVGTGFNPEMTGRENVYLNGAILGMTKAEIDAKMEQIIDFSEVREFIDTPVKRYSSGMFVKLAFSVAAHLDAEIMIMDEVLAVGDMAFQTKCLDKMREAAKRDGRTVLYVSHNMNTIRKLCERCIVLEKGKVVFNGDVEEAIRQYLGLNEEVDFPNRYDFSDNKREYHFGKEVFIRSLTFKNRDNSVMYKIGEKIQIDFIIDSSIEVEAAQLVIFVVNKNNLRNVFSVLTSPFNLHKGSGLHYSFLLNSDCLVADVYYLNFELIKRDEFGNYFAYDSPRAKAFFEMYNDDEHDIVWPKNYWGCLRLPEIPVVDTSSDNS